MRGLQEIEFINANPKLHAASRDEATARQPAANEVKRLATQAAHGARVLARQQQNRASVR